jgi:dolichyl-phosphate beta-glucosyltransferase
MSSEAPNFLLVIPCYREGTRLGSFLRPLCAGIAASGIPVLVRVVEDGSGVVEQKITCRIVDDLRGEYPFLLPALILPRNHGKGGAIYAGWDAQLNSPYSPGSKAKQPSWVGFADADGATSAGEICRLLAEIIREPERADGWLGSRVKMLGRNVERTLKRHLMGRAYATLATFATGLAVYDSQCGCKFFRAEKYIAVREHLQDQRFGFDMELLAWLHRNGARMVEFPVDWSDIPGSKVHLLRDSWRMFRSLLALKLNLEK